MSTTISRLGSGCRSRGIRSAPYSLDISGVFSRVSRELHGDRSSPLGDDQALIGGHRLDRWAGGHDQCPTKGRDVKENLRRNFGMPHPPRVTARPSGCMRIGGEVFRMPVISLYRHKGGLRRDWFRGNGMSRRRSPAICARWRVLEVPTVGIIIGRGRERAGRSVMR